MVTMVTQFWENHPAVSAVRVHAPMDLTVGVTLLHLVTRTTVTDKSSATVTRVTQVSLTLKLPLYFHQYSPSPLQPQHM